MYLPRASSVRLTQGLNTHCLGCISTVISKRGVTLPRTLMPHARRHQAGGQVRAGGMSSAAGARTWQV